MCVCVCVCGARVFGPMIVMIRTLCPCFDYDIGVVTIMAIQMLHPRPMMIEYGDRVDDKEYVGDDDKFGILTMVIVPTMLNTLEPGG